MTVSGASKNHSPENGPGPISRRPVLWLNVLCLDAPLVAVTWQWFFSRTFHLALPIGAVEALFLTAWLIYLLDRWFDSISIVSGAATSLRGAFCRRHQSLWLGLILVVALLDAAAIFWRLDHDTFIAGTLLAAVALVYLIINGVFSEVWNIVSLKEIGVGFLFAAGTVVVFLPDFGPARPGMALAAFLFACLCALNCMSIAVWERELDQAQRKHSIATRYSRAGVYVRWFAILLAAADGALVWIDQELWTLAVCLGSSVLLIFALNFWPIAREERTALADLVLLTPLVLVLVERIR